MIGDEGEAPARIETRSWYAVWTRSHCEEQVTDELIARGFDTFLPTAQAWVQHRGRRRRLVRPLFPGYLFVHHAMDPASHADLLRARGVVRLLGQGHQPIPIADEEVTAVRRLALSGLPVSRRGLFAHGNRVRVVAGPLAGLEGRFQRSRGHKGLFVIAVTLLHRSVAVEVDAAFVEVL
jgi:transcription antitermination factor NusG